MIGTKLRSFRLLNVPFPFRSHITLLVSLPRSLGVEEVLHLMQPSDSVIWQSYMSSKKYQPGGFRYEVPIDAREYPDRPFSRPHLEKAIATGAKAQEKQIQGAERSYRMAKQQLIDA